jgi:hypothetical protein
MFTKYFREKTKKIWKDYNSFKKSLSKEKEVEEKQEKKKKKKVILPKDILINFLEEHLPERYKVAENGTIIDSKSAEVNGDIIIYHHYCPKIMDMTGGKFMVEFVHSVIEYEETLSFDNIGSHINRIKDIKSLNVILANEEVKQSIVGVVFAYKSLEHIKDLKRYIIEFNKANNISIMGGVCTDIFVVLDQGLIIADYSSDRKYVAIETQEDTLMWFYILLMEWIDSTAPRVYSLRDYIKRLERYPEY